MKKKSILNYAGLLVVSTLCFLGFTTTVYAEGWDSTSGEWKYLDSANNPV